MEYLDHTVLKLSGVFMVEIIKKIIQSNLNGSNTFGTTKICLRQV